MTKMDKKNRNKRIRRALLLAVAAIWLLARLGKKKGRRYTQSERHEYYKFLG